jgi:uncharacterized protein YaiL (DUF2058 family)
MASLQDQLLKAGLVNEKKAKQAGKEKRRQAKQARRSGEELVDENKQAAEKARQEKIAKDKALNAEREAAAQAKAIQAQIQQLITMNVDSYDGDIAYNFADGKKIKKIYVSDKLQKQLSLGQLAIVRHDDRYALVPAAVANKIAERDESVVVALVDRAAERAVEAAAEDDPYADYKIPDDLMW